MIVENLKGALTMAIELYRNEIEGLPQDYNRDEKVYIVVRQVMGKTYYVDAFNVYLPAYELSRTLDGGHIAYLLEDYEEPEPEYDSDDWDEEPSDYCDDLGFDPYEGCYTFDC